MKEKYFRFLLQSQTNHDFDSARAKRELLNFVPRIMTNRKHGHHGNEAIAALFFFCMQRKLLFRPKIKDFKILWLSLLKISNSEKKLYGKYISSECGPCFAAGKRRMSREGGGVFGQGAGIEQKP